MQPLQPADGYVLQGRDGSGDGDGVHGVHGVPGVGPPPDLLQTCSHLLTLAPSCSQGPQTSVGSSSGGGIGRRAVPLATLTHVGEEAVALTTSRPGYPASSSSSMCRRVLSLVLVERAVSPGCQSVRLISLLREGTTPRARGWVERRVGVSSPVRVGFVYGSKNQWDGYSRCWVLGSHGWWPVSQTSLHLELLTSTLHIELLTSSLHLELLTSSLHLELLSTSL